MSKKKDTDWLIKKSKSLFDNLFDYSNSQYINAQTKITFSCIKHNHTFSQTSNNHFKSKHPCEICLKESRKETFSFRFELFKSKISKIYGDNFNFDNAVYVNQRTPISLTCLKHNKLITKVPQAFLEGQGCDICTKELFNQKNSLISLKEINAFCKKLNGKCQSINYTNNKSKLNFECEFGHEFLKSWSEVKNSLRWCPKCSPNKLIGESLARLILEHLLQIELPSAYIDKMEGLQLDGFNENRNIAFEYQGYQHYTKKSHFHSEDSRFESQLNRDRVKKELCLKNGITLIEIFEFKTIRAGRIDLFVQQVKENLENLNLEYTSEPFILNLIELYRGRKSLLYDKAKKIVSKNNGILEEFIGSESKHIYHCHKGHKITNRTLGVIINSNASCPICDSEKRFNDLKSIIEKKGGVLLENKLKPKGLSENYNWKCNKGHICVSKGQYLYNGFWCIKCQRENKIIKLSKKKLSQLQEDVISGKFYQKDIPTKYGISSNTYRRIIKELKISTNYLPQDRKLQKKINKGELLQIDPIDFHIVKKFESLEAVKYDESGLFKPEGIRFQMKKFKKAYGFYWSRLVNLEETLKIIKLNNF